jgi:hypothetical protein
LYAATGALPIDPTPIVNKISSQEILFAVLVLFVSAALFVFCLKFFYKLLLKRDEVIKEFATQVATLNTCLTKVIEVQSLDHSATIKNRDLLQETSQILSRVDLNLNQITQELRDLWRELKEHAKECQKKSLGRES